MPLSEVRSPNLKLVANGIPIIGVINVEVISNNHFGADHFNATLALDADPGLGSIWSSQADITIDVQASLDGSVFARFITGIVDTIDIDVLNRTIRLDGRDLTSVFIETRTQETFSNRTSSEIAALLAQRHNLSAQITNTTTPVGRYYQSQHDRITLDQFSRATTEWDLLVFLAQQEGFDVFVQASTLYFQPASMTGVTALRVTPDAVLDLRLERALTLARDIEVVVKSWNSRQQSSFTQTARSRAPRLGGRGSSSNRPQRYVFVRPNLTMDQALKFAQQKLAELSQLERVISLTMPGELSLTPRSVIALTGTNTDFDQVYSIDRIERHIGISHGFVQHVRAKNMSPGRTDTTPADVVVSTTGNG